jgi:hypothetical protein
LKRCSCCKKLKRKKAFHKCSSRKDGVQRHCKVCRKKIDHDRYAANPEKHRETRKKYAKTHKKELRHYQIEKKYGITAEQWDKLFKKQGKKCAICGSKRSGNKHGWDTDHNHETGKARGILCHGCNVLLGGAKDSIRVLRKAIKYLKKRGFLNV